MNRMRIATVFKYISCLYTMVLAFALAPLASFELTMTASSGEQHRLEFQPEESFQSVIEMAKWYLKEKDLEMQTIRMDVYEADGNLLVKAYECPKTPPRNYYAPISSQEKKDLAFILRTMANNSLIKIAKEKSNLKKAGERIENLHPFKFLEAIFTDEELKVCLRNIEGKSWVWSEFRDGIIGSLCKESAVDNLKLEYIQSFANLIKIDANAIVSTILDKNWSKLVSDLIAIVPRSGDSGRYNM